MKKLKIGVIGVGNISELHIDAYLNNPECELYAFCDIDEGRLKEKADKYKISRRYTDCREMLRALPELDAVSVCTWNCAHADCAIAALEAGKHVMCEKPMAKTYAEAKEMVEVAKETGKILTIGYQNRYRPDSQYLKRACENGELGEIYFAKAHAIRRRAVPTWGVFLNEYEQGGGPLIDIGTHALDLTLWMMDNYKPKMVVGTTYKKLGDQKESGNAWGDWDPEKFTVEDSAFGFITMEDGATIILESSWALNSLDVDEAKTSLCGTKAGADMKGGLRINGVKYNKQYVEEPNLESGGVDYFEGDLGGEPQDFECRTWINAITKGTPLTVLPEQAAVVTQILEAIYESAKTGKPVYLNDC